MRERIDLEGILSVVKDTLNIQSVLEKASNTHMSGKRLRTDSWVEDSQLLEDIGIYGNLLENEMQRCLVKMNISPHHRRASRGLITLNLYKEFSLYMHYWRRKAITSMRFLQGCILAWKIPWTEEPGRLQSMGSLSRTRLSNFTFTFHFHALEKEMAKNPRDGGAWWADVYGDAQSRTQLKWLSSSSMLLK